MTRVGPLAHAASPVVVTPSPLTNTQSVISNLFKRNSVYVATIFGGAFAFQGFFDVAVTKWYENHNKGKLWKDIKGKLGEAGDDDDDE